MFYPHDACDTDTHCTFTIVNGPLGQVLVIKLSYCKEGKGGRGLLCISHCFV